MIEINRFRPSSVAPRPAARSTYSIDSIGVLGGDTSSHALTRRVRGEAAERADGDSFKEVSNPGFAYGNKASDLARHSKGDPRILRGYIRRSVPNDSRDPTSKYRLYFMFNPTVIQRQFVSYLDQQALDPFNTIFNSGNLVAPPSILDFSFELFFDRQLEVAWDANHPGTGVDYDYFDRVIRGVEPGGNPTALPDSGTLLINPRNIKVVFSPHLTVEGRPYQAQVRYEKFSHRMTPIRMRILLSMKAQYIGPDLPNEYQLSLSTASGKFSATVPYEESVKASLKQKDIGDVQLSSQFTPTLVGTTVSGQVGTVSGGVVGAILGSTPGNGDASMIWPVRGRVSQEFGNNGHPGIDIAAGGGAPIYAAKSGVVTVVVTDPSQNELGQPGSPSGYGCMVTIDHGGGLLSRYAHMPVGGPKVQRGQQVTQGQQIGVVDSTGTSTGHHLHWEVHTYSGAGPAQKGRTVNPRNYCPGNPQT